MILEIKPTEKLKGTVKAPPSKSYTHRAVIIASLAEGRSVIRNPLISGDTLASVNACKTLGAGIDVRGDEIIVDGVGGSPVLPEKIIDAGNSGTTLRIMTAVASLCQGKVALTGDESIQKRPMQPLLKALEDLGVKTSSVDGKPPVTVEGPSRGGLCRIRGDVSSQFISGLLITAPCMAEDTMISVTTELKSRPYIDLTLDVMRNFGVKASLKENGFHVAGGQKYVSIDYSVEGDYSSSAFILAAASLLGSEVVVEDLYSESKQGDRAIVNILKEMGADLEVDRDRIKVSGGGGLEGIELDGSDTPDLVPVLAVLGSFAGGRTLIGNVGHLRYKESDRLKALSTELRKMGAKIKEKEDGLEITGVKSLRGAYLHGWNDHRIVMALAIAGLKAEGETTVDNADSVGISFPGFVDVMRKLGSNIKVQGL
jgi:3-phosphoshikimate 1-carboxyvinyltransferase